MTTEAYEKLETMIEDFLIENMTSEAREDEGQLDQMVECAIELADIYEEQIREDWTPEEMRAFVTEVLTHDISIGLLVVSTFETRY
jgi:hypothetical protein